MCIFHKWSKWEQYDVINPYTFTSFRGTTEGQTTTRMQKRICNKCGKEQVEKTAITKST